MASTNRLAPIPHPPTKPYVGNLLSIDFKAPAQHLARLAKELGPIFWLDMMGVPMVIVSGVDLVDELSDTTRFDKAVRGALRRIRALAGDGLFTAESKEPNWAKAHNILLAPFSNRAMQILSSDDARHRRAARQEMGAPQRRRRDRRRPRHDRADARHDRPLRLRLPLQFVLPPRLPPLRRGAGALARDGR